MEHRRPGRVYRLRFQPPAQFDFLASPRDQLEAAIVPGNRTTRYNRTWIIGQTELEGDVLSGRIGFQGDGTTDWWDDERKDFIEIGIPSGTTAPFAINLETLEAAMQPRSGQIKIRGLIGAFEKLLLDSGFKWRIVGLNQTISLEQWKASVDKVVAVKFLIKKPNPHYGDREDLKELMEELESEAIRLEAFNENEGVNMEAPFILQTEEHIQAGYGDAEYRGIKGEGSDARESVYVTDVGQEEDSEEVPVDPTSGEVPTSRLRSMISNESEEGENDDRAQLNDPFSDN